MTFRNLLILILAVAGTLCSTIAWAQDASHNDTQTPRQFGAKAGAIVNEALLFMDNDKYELALSKLNIAAALPDLSAYERSTIYQMQGAAHYELGRYGAAIDAFEEAIDAGGFSTAESENLDAQIAQVMIANGNYRAGAKRLEAWIKRGGELSASRLDLLVKAWLQAEDFNRVLPWAEKWFAQAKPKERKHFDAMNYIFYRLDMPSRQAEIINQMIERWPDDKALWESRVSLLASEGREVEAFETRMEMYHAGLIEAEPELLKLVQYHGYHEIPYWGAMLLETELQSGRVTKSTANLKNLANLWRQAREYDRAIPVLEQLVLLDKNAALFAELGEAHIKEGHCAKAEAAFTQAIRSGYATGKPWMLIGTCRYEAAQDLPKPGCHMSETQYNQNPRVASRRKARAAFEKVVSPSNLKRDASAWIGFIDQEEQVQKNLCGEYGSQKRDLCFIQIDQTYDAIVFTKGKFELHDETCLEYKEEFDRLYPGRNKRQTQAEHIPSKP